MANYFYDCLIAGTITHDAVGTVCRDDAAALRYGWIKLSNLMSQQAQILHWQHFGLIVRREDGVQVGQIAMTATIDTEKPRGHGNEARNKQGLRATFEAR